MVDTGASASVDLDRPFVEAHRLVEAMPDAKPSDRRKTIFLEPSPP